MEIRSDRSEIVDERGQAVVVPTQAPVAVVADSVGTETVLTSRTVGFTPAAIVASVVAVALLIIGGITVARAGFDGSLDEPVVTVAGYTATALLGIFEIAFGLLLLMAALSRSQGGILFFAIVGGVMALVAVFQPSVGEGSLAIERGFAVWVAIAMGVVVFAALLPTVRRRSVVQRTTDVA